MELINYNVLASNTISDSDIFLIYLHKIIKIYRPCMRKYYERYDINQDMFEKVIICNHKLHKNPKDVSKFDLQFFDYYWCSLQIWWYIRMQMFKCRAKW